MSKAILKVKQVNKSFSLPGQEIRVLKGINFLVAAGSSTAIVGPSGSGKSTLLALCAGLDQPTSGSIILNGSALEELNEDERAKLRNESVGFVFQNFQLIPTLTALENVLVPLELRGGGRNSMKPANELLDMVGLGNRIHHYPTQLSGGEQQRVALARAFINRPALLFADEPTGNLDQENSQVIEDLLFELNHENGATLIIVTHNLDLARKTDRTIQLRGGEIVEESDGGLEGRGNGVME